MNNFFPANANLNINADLTKPAEDITGMAKNTHKGVGKLFYALLGPWIEERIGKAKRGAAQAEKDSLDILAGHARLDEETKTMISIGNVSSVDALCEELEKANSQCKAKRLAAALMAASIEMKQVPEVEVSDEPLNQTFFNHWREEAELIDDEDLRQWWAHLLVEETKKPNSISPRTLDVVKNLSREEVEIFIKNIVYVYAGGIIQTNKHQAIASDLSEIITLQDAGLVISAQFLKQHLELTCEINNNKYICMMFPDNKNAVAFKAEKISFSCYVLTTAGNELYKMFKKVESLEEIKAIAQEVSKQNNNAEYVVYPISHIGKNNDGTMTYQFTLTPVWSSAADNGDTK